MTTIDRLLSFIEEDAPFGDITSEVLIPPERECNARILTRQPCTVAGVEEASLLFTHFGCTVRRAVQDGDRAEAGTTIMEITGKTRAILLLERTALNLMGRMSGIATATSRAAEKAAQANPRVRVAATRKTAPGLRDFDKKAVQLGGGEPHRFCLSDQVLIKDNHLQIVPIEQAVARARTATLYKKIEVEVENPEDALRAARAGADMILLDNMKPLDVQKTLDLLESEGMRKSVLIEVSGTITEGTLETYAVLDIDVISMGSLTHTVTTTDVSLEILPGVQTIRL
jgi:nicotinate-nucleotide pyrophosphorylase (carboxylating)